MKQKQTIEQFLPQLKLLATKYDFTQKMELAIKKHQEFKLRLPLVGAFSSGKSTLINTFLGEKLLGVEVDPETCLPTELFYAEQEMIQLMSNDGKESSLSRSQLKDQDYLLSIQQQDKEYWIEIGLPNKILAQHKDLVLVDMPGWDSDIAEHTLAIDNYVQKSGAYCLAISANDGTIRSSIQQALIELKLFKKPVVLIITRADKVSKDELIEVVANIASNVEQYLEISPLAIITTAARKKQINGFSDALNQVVLKSDVIYENMVLGDFYILFERMNSKLNILLNEDNLTVEQAQIACDAIPEQLVELQLQLSELEQKINEIVPTCVEAAKSNFSNNLKAQLNSLASSVQYGSSIQNQISNALRSAYLTAVEQDFKPKLARQLKSLQNVSDIAPSNVDISNSFSASEGQSNNLMFTQIISFVLTKVVTLVPILKPFSPIIYAVASLFTNKMDKERQQEQQKEEAKQYVLNTLIPQVISQVEPTIRAGFNDMALNVKQEIREESERKAADKKKALIELQASLLQAKDQDSQQKLHYQESINEMASITSQLSI